jgi:hypothetical protein
MRSSEQVRFGGRLVGAMVALFDGGLHAGCRTRSRVPAVQATPPGSLVLRLGVPGGRLHVGFHFGACLSFCLGVCGDGGMDVAGEVAPGTPSVLVGLGLLLAPRLTSGRPVLVPKLLNLGLQLVGGPLPFPRVLRRCVPRAGPEQALEVG